MNQIDPSEGLSVSQVLALTEMPKSRIRYYEREFSEFLQAARTVGNQRRFTKADVKILTEIERLVEVEGYTLRGVRRQLELQKADPPDGKGGQLDLKA